MLNERFGAYALPYIGPDWTGLTGLDSGIWNKHFRTLRPFTLYSVLLCAGLYFVLCLPDFQHTLNIKTASSKTCFTHSLTHSLTHDFITS